MQKALTKSARIALGLTIILGLGCGGSSNPPNPDAKDGPKESATGNAGTGGAGKDGGAGTDGGAGKDGAAGTGAAGSDGGAGTGAAGNDGGAGTGAAGNDGGAGTGAAGNDGGAGKDGGGGTDGGAGTGAAGNDGGAAGNDGGAAGSDAAAGSDGGSPDADGGSADSDVACTNACTLNAKQCGTGGIQTCVVGSNGCTAWGAAAACAAHQSCTGASGSAACTCNVDPICGSGTAKACDSGGALITCGLDANNCAFVVTTAACPAHQACIGTNPNASCECVTPPTECAGGANTTFCSTSTAVRTCKVDNSNAKNCLFADTAVSCGTHQACTTPSAGAAVCSCVADANCTNANTPGNLCSGNSTIHCAKDADNCPFTETNTACNAHSTCNAGTGLCGCNASICTTTGPTCNGGNVSTCAQDGACFFVSATAATCTANETCQGAAGAAACVCNAAPAACTAGAGTYCGAGGVTTCVADAHQCVTVSGNAVACNAHSTCQGAAGQGACVCNAAPAGCTGAGTFCSNTGTKSVCQMDGTCPFSVPADDTACLTHQTCKAAGLGGACTCDDTCDATKAGGVGSYCVSAGSQATCANDGNGCFIAGATTACVGTMSCRGADGNGFCQCQPVGLTAGTSCTTLGATICQDNTVLTCTQDPLAPCLIWAQPKDCATPALGLVCGTKSGVAACQCADHTGNDWFVSSFDGTDTQSGVFPSGNQFPANCRFGTIGKALSLATSGQRVVAKTESAGPMPFNSETFPINVGAGVTLTTLEGVAQAGKYVLNFNTAGSAAVNLASNSVLEAFEIDNGGGTASASLVSVVGTSVTIDSDILKGFDALAGGISVSGAGQAAIIGGTVDGFTTGISVASSGAATTMSSTKVQSNATGVSVSAGTLSVISGDVTANTTAGIAVSGGSATLGAVQVHDNAAPGISQSGGTLTIGASTIGPLNANGLQVAAGTVTVNTGAHFDGNSGSGILSLGSVILNGSAAAPITASGNAGDGVSIGGGNLTSSYLTANANGTGVTKNSGLKISGTAVVNLGAAGDAALLFTNNGLHGVNIAATAAGSAISVTRSTISGNGGDGVSGDLNGGTSNPGASASITASTISGNTGHGIEVRRAPLVSSVTKFAMDGLTISGNGGSGVFLRGDLGSVGASLKNSKVATNTGVGVRVEQVTTTQETIQNCSIINNTGGGVAFNTSSTLSSFTGNTVAGNTGDQILIAAAQNGGATWNFRSPGNTCDANRNQVFCYGNGGVGIRVTSNPTATSVDAENMNWLNSAASAGTDYALMGAAGNTLNAAFPCAQVTSCP